MSLQVTTPPTAEPITLDEVKARLRLTTSNDDTTILQQITAAREYAEKLTGLSLAAKSYLQTMDRFPHPYDPIRLMRPPLLSVTSVTYLDCTLTSQTWDPSEYYVAANNVPALIVPKPGIVYPDTGRVPGAVAVAFLTGADCPEMLKEGIRQLTVHIYEHPDAVTSEGLKEAPLALTAFFNSKKVYSF
jgi:uncharacterized phiE125 gp8 family phage protein